MITFSKLGQKGNLGNQLFQIASTFGIAAEHEQAVCFPDWKYERYFQGILPNGTLSAQRRQEPYFHYAKNWNLNPQMNYDIEGWLQSRKYWQAIEKHVKDELSFKSAMISYLVELHPDWFASGTGRQTIAISVRRGDYVGNPNYELLPASYYYLALLEHFPDYKNYNIIFFSDDIGYCKVQFEGLPNVHFAEGHNDIEQLCLMSLCNHFIIANSTFSWWGAYLGQRNDSKVIRPNYLFAGNLLAENSDQDFWPEEWIVFDHQGKKLPLQDVTFTVPVFFDHQDRKENLSLSICMLQRDFDTNIIVGENGNKLKYFSEWCRYHEFNMKHFHRTKMLNDMSLMATTPIIVNWDCDVIIPALQIWLAVEAIRKNEAQMVYPYDGRFARVPRLPWFKKIRHYYDIGVLGNTELKGKKGRPMPVSSVGGAIIFNREAFIAGGMENEHMISFGPEDWERWFRFERLGYTIKRITGCLYHIDHFIGPNSSGKNPHFKHNHDEYDKMRAMNDVELKEYVSGWKWLAISKK